MLTLNVHLQESGILVYSEAQASTGQQCSLVHTLPGEKTARTSAQNTISHNQCHSPTASSYKTLKSRFVSDLYSNRERYIMTEF